MTTLFNIQVSDVTLFIIIMSLFIIYIIVLFIDFNKLSKIVSRIDNLETIYKQPFVMYFRGFKYYEIAEKLDIPIGTVKNRIHIARKELKHHLKSYATK